MEGTVKHCIKCKQDKDLSCFSNASRRKDGKQSYCKKCKATMDADSHKKNPAPVKEGRKRSVDKAQKYVRELLQQSQCVDCGESNWIVLEFDHLDDKILSISKMIRGYSVESIKAEIAKCDIVCANCHRIRTYTRAGSWRTTGC